MTSISLLEKWAENIPEISSGKKQIKIPEIKERDREELYAFSIVPREYEAELDEKYGIKLEKIKNGKRSGFKGDLKNNVSFRSNEGKYHPELIRDRIWKRYHSLPGFCSMIVKDKEELDYHIKNIHEISYNHYVFGKESNIRSRFPESCCRISSRNLLLTLMDKGYPNASLLENCLGDHTYNGLPFLFGKEMKKGFIIVDPTSDQLFKNKENAPRNNIFVSPGDKWTYKTDWEGGKDLYPYCEDSSIFSNLQTIRKGYNNNGSILRDESIEEEKYFERVFENPVEVNIDSL